ncbi:hypothetical protein Q3C19_01485, partial [Bacteroides sp. ET489]|uniref:DUF7833 domain-containing protein n=1 Tax=Bacteroides sp. ET489 TaxID=3057126 RepID=UPI002672FAC6
MIGHFYFTHPIGASDDPRMEAMEEKLHGKGSGVYWYIREKMSYFSNNRCRLKQLVRFATRYYNKQMIEWVVQESGLFGCDEEDYFFPLKLKCELEAEDKSDIPSQPAICPSENRETPPKTTGKNSRKTTNNTRNASVSGKKTAENNENRTKISEKTAEIDEKSSENSKKTAKNGPKTAQNSTKKAPKPMEIAAQPSENEATDNNIHTKSNTNTSTIYKEKKKEKEKDVVVVATPPPTTTPPASPTAIRPWQQYVAELNSDSEWGQIVCMKSGYGALLKKHWETAKELFRQHVIAMGKEQSLLTQDEAKRYFMSFAATCPTTAGELRQQLLRLEQAATATA